MKEIYIFKHYPPPSPSPIPLALERLPCTLITTPSLKKSWIRLCSIKVNQMMVKSTDLFSFSEGMKHGAVFDAGPITHFITHFL